eukprot:m.16562 g.16562  ORF g.16562 m.16562 type:complete len:548 (+) comp27015_c0_seq1:332-1975(+)
MPTCDGLVKSTVGNTSDASCDCLRSFADCIRRWLAAEVTRPASGPPSFPSSASGLLLANRGWADLTRLLDISPFPLENQQRDADFSVAFRLVAPSPPQSSPIGRCSRADEQLTCTNSRDERTSPSNKASSEYTNTPNDGNMAQAGRVKSARLTSRPRDSARRSLPRTKSTGALPIRRNSMTGRRLPDGSVPDFHTTSAAGPSPSLIAHMKIFSRRADEARQGGGHTTAMATANMRIDGARPVYSPRNNPHPGKAFVAWKVPRHLQERERERMERDAKMSFYDEYRGTYGSGQQQQDDGLVTNLSKLKLDPESYVHKATSTRSIPGWTLSPQEDYQAEYNQDEQFGETVDTNRSSASVESNLKCESQKSVTFALKSDAKPGVENWLQQASEKERTIAMDFFKALQGDSKSTPGSTAAAIARMPKAPPKQKQPNFTLQGKKQKLNASLGSKDPPLLRSTSCRSHMEEFKQKELKYLMRKMEKTIDPKKYVGEFQEKPLEQLPSHQHKHRRVYTDPGTYPRSFFAPTKNPNRGYFVISTDWASENLVTTY